MRLKDDLTRHEGDERFHRHRWGVDKNKIQGCNNEILQNEHELKLIAKVKNLDSK